MMPTLTLTLRLAVALALSALAVPSTVQATGNVVPNPSFDEPCNKVTRPCRWNSADLHGQGFWNPHSGESYMWLYGADSAGAESDCVPLGQGDHVASYWHRTIDGTNFGVSVVGFIVSFYSEAGCGGSGSSWELPAFNPIGDNQWYQEAGVFVAPLGTTSARFGLEMAGWCDGPCMLGETAEFDDLDVESMMVSPQSTSHRNN